jgi:hypothetical protein
MIVSTLTFCGYLGQSQFALFGTQPVSIKIFCGQHGELTGRGLVREYEPVIYSPELTEIWQAPIADIFQLFNAHSQGHVAGS